MKHVVFVGILVAAFGASGHARTNAEPGTGPQVIASGDVNVPVGEVALGTVSIPRRVMADGSPLAAGSYQVRLTAESAQPDAVGQLPQLERWVEFRQGNEVRGREVVSIVPASEIGEVASVTPPRSGDARVQLLRGNDYLRIWISRDGTHYLLHLRLA